MYPVVRIKCQRNCCLVVLKFSFLFSRRFFASVSVFFFFFFSLFPTPENSFDGLSHFFPPLFFFLLRLLNLCSIQNKLQYFISVKVFKTRHCSRWGEIRWWHPWSNSCVANWNICNLLWSKFTKPHFSWPELINAVACVVLLPILVLLKS